MISNIQAIFYTIIHVGSNTENESFITSTSRGSFLSLSAAREELAKQISEEKSRIPTEYDCEERGEDFWMSYQDGFAAAAYTRLEIVTTTLNLERSA